MQKIENYIGDKKLTDHNALTMPSCLTFSELGHRFAANPTKTTDKKTLSRHKLMKKSMAIRNPKFEFGKHCGACKKMRMVRGDARKPRRVVGACEKP